MSLELGNTLSKGLELSKDAVKFRIRRVCHHGGANEVNDRATTATT